jgi:ADP-glucose pyrophosphorylase
MHIKSVPNNPIGIVHDGVINFVSLDSRSYILGFFFVGKFSAMNAYLRRVGAIDSYFKATRVMDELHSIVERIVYSPRQNHRRWSIYSLVPSNQAAHAYN